MPHVAVVGNLARDRVDGGPPQLGGCPLFAARVLRASGRSGHVLARCAPGDRSGFADELRELGVPATILPGVRTAGFDHVYDGESRTTTVTELGDPWTAADAAHVAPEARWVHVAPLLRSDFPPDALAALAGGGRTLCLDGQGLVRVPRLGPLVQDAAFDRSSLARVSVLKLSEEEARIAVQGSFDSAAARGLGVAEIVVTRGSEGADVWVDGERTHVPTTPVHGVETTGAGDAFTVAYVLARADGASPVDAARAAGRRASAMLAERRLP